MPVYDHASAVAPGSRVEPPSVEHDGLTTELALSFGPVAILQPNSEGTGFVVNIYAKPNTVFSQPLVSLRLAFDAQIKPVLELLDVRLR